MIVNKKSALIGFGLFLYALVTILALIGCCITREPFFITAGILNFVCNWWVICSIYKHYSDKE